jgi:hypothetical protein
MRFTLNLVEFMPKHLEPGTLYASNRFGAAAHLCPCGCGSKIRTPLGPTEWTLTKGPQGPTLYPSIGNWQLPCRSHYWIRDGKVKWAGQWTEEEVMAGREEEARRHRAYYGELPAPRDKMFAKVWRWLSGRFRRDRF